MIRNILLPFVIDENLRKEIVNFSYYSYRGLWNKNVVEGTKNRFFCRISDLDIELNKKTNDLKLEVFDLLGVKDLKEEFMFGNFIGINLEGGNVHVHKDPEHEGWYHTRINFLIQKPLKGGMPIINGWQFNINQSQCWYNSASLWDHGSTVVQGNLERIIVSLGAYIHPNDHYRINQDILNN